MSQKTATSVAIIGAGPVGLAAAAHALERGLMPTVLERGGESATAVRQWAHVRMFSPWRFNTDAACTRLLAATGWVAPNPDHYPTGGAFVASYLAPLTTGTALRDHILTDAEVISVSRAGFDKVKSAGREQAPFEIHYRTRDGERMLHADAVIDASGTWAAPNPAGANGVAAVGESACAHRIAYGMPDVLGGSRARYAGKRVAVLGAGHSAIGTLIDLVTLADAVPETRPTWLLRGASPERAFGGGASDQLAARGELGSTFARLVGDGRLEMHTRFAVTHIEEQANGLAVSASDGCCSRQIIVDELIVATGFRPDLSFLRELRVTLDPAIECPPALAPLIDPNEHSCGTVRPHGARELAHPEPGFYIAGMKSYGRAPTFLAMTGYEQVRSIIAELSGDYEAARRVELVLPETGVCTGSPLSSAEGCCAPPKAETSSCCGVTPAPQIIKAGCCAA